MSRTGYLHDVFISYRREPHAWTPWTRDHFRTLMQSYLQQELLDTPDIYVDERIEVGADYPRELGIHLAKSSVMVAVFSGDYFRSEWCLHELDLMLGRSMAAEQDNRLIIPVIVHDGDLIPPEVGRKQASIFTDFRVAHINRDTPLYQNFSLAMRDLAPQIKRAIDTCPEFNPSWVDECQQRMSSVYDAYQKGNTVDVRHFTPQTIVIPNRPPRP